MNDMDVIVYTKGSGENEDGRYGWAYTLEYMTSENDEMTDSFRTEMSAVLSALKALDKSVSVEVRTNNEAIAKICNGEYKVLDGELRETQTANYFSDVYPIDCTVSPANALFCRKNGTLLQAGNLL